MCEEVGTQDEKGHLATVIGQRKVITHVCVSVSKQPAEHPLEHRACVPTVGDRRGDHLTNLAHPGRQAVVLVLSVAAAEAREAAEQKRSGHEDATHTPMPVLLHPVVEVHHRAAILVLGDADIVQEEEGEVAQLGLASQKVGSSATEHVG